MRSGFCAIVGRPNVGKSTLLNAAVGQKVAITTPVPQTTRHAIRGVLHRPDRDGGVQIVFVDTPGLHKPKTLLGSRLNEVARATLSDVDVVVLMVDGSAEIGRGDAYIAGLLAAVETPAIAVVNKIDRITRTRQLPQLARVAELGNFDEIVPLSAATGEGTTTLIELLIARMPEGPAYFPSDQVSDQSPEQLVAEVIREKAITLMREEVPHSIAVTVDEFGPGESEGVTAISATLYVERDSQKGIVIGKGGAVLRNIGSRSREELQRSLDARIFLNLRVKLSKEWQRDPKKLERLGY
ncbi:MAG: GTPase Era [Actinomycetota bacterium]|jgi:GTP-binding protein Era|nr:GTPase Era [Actinomycetota bacterium]